MSLKSTLLLSTVLSLGASLPTLAAVPHVSSHSEAFHLSHAAPHLTTPHIETSHIAEGPHSGFFAQIKPPTPTPEIHIPKESFVTPEVGRVGSKSPDPGAGGGIPSGAGGGLPDPGAGGGAYAPGAGGLPDPGGGILGKLGHDIGET